VRNSATTILRWGLAFVFFYAAVASLLRPYGWSSYLPGFLLTVIPARWLLSLLAVYELILAVLLFIGRKLYWVSILSVISFAAAVIFNLNLLDAVFENVGLAFASLVLFELVREKRGKEVTSAN